MRLRVTAPPPLGESVVNRPPRRILPSACSCDGIDKAVRVRVESGVERAVRVQPGNVVARHRRSAVGRERGKRAAEKDLPVRLDDDNANRVVCVWIETVERGLPARHCRTAADRQNCKETQEKCRPRP